MMNRTTLAAAGLLVSMAGSAFAQEVTSPVSAFDARAAKHRNGVFFTLEDIHKRSPARVSDLFRGLSGIALSNNDGGKVILVSSRGGRTGMISSPTSGMTGTSTATAAIATGGPPASPNPTPGVSAQQCSLLVGVDGQMMDPQFSVDDVAVSSVHGIEVYTGSARIPVEFGAGNNAGCGVVMIWSKTGADKP